MWYFALSGFINFLILLTAGLLAVIKYRKSPINRAYSNFSFFVALWSLCYFFWLVSPIEKNALFWAKSLTAMTMYIPAAFFHFVDYLINEKLTKRRAIRLAYIISTILFLLIPTPLVVRGVFKQLFFEYWPAPGPLYIFYICYFLLVVTYSIILIFRGYKCAKGQRRDQLKYTFFGLLIGFMGGATNFFLWYGIPIPPYGNILVSVCGLFLIYAILRHRLLNIEIVIRKSLIYSILIAFITSVYLVFVLFIERFFQGLIGYKSIIVSIAAAFLIALFFIPLRNKIQRFVDKYFFKGSQEALARENERLMIELQRSERLKAVATLAAGMAHEIKNPLSSIKTFTEYLPQKFQDADYREKFTRIVGNEVDKINKIVQDLLDFAKPKPLELKQTDINKLLDDTIALLSNDLMKSKIDIKKEYDQKTSKITADPNKLKQAILNLLLNSMEAMEKQGVITVSTKQENNYLTVQIKDTGKGIQEKDVPHIFDPFYSTKAGGTGLGLSIVHGIIEEHKGAVEVESKPKEGTVFTIKLPVF